jgi:acetylornithine/N-succinyldiaminopimelate aminotransferase
MKLMNTYKRYPVTFVRGEGMHLFDEAGREYLDFVAGIAVTALGHSHPAVVEAIVKQASQLTHVSNLYFTKPMADLSDKLCELLEWEDGRVFFANSGAEANECAIKLVRKWSREKYSGGRFETIAAMGSFHGRTLETLAATGQPKKWESFQPLPPGFRHVPFDDLGALEGAVDEKVASILLEPVQGEGGVLVPADEYLPGVRKICDAHDLAFVADEVQTGLGRTGQWFAFQDSGAVPDVITLAKALGNGLPIGACIARGELAGTFQPGDHATTMGAGPVVCAAALTVIRVIDSEGLVERSKEVGGYLQQLLRDMIDPHDCVEEVRGKGLLLAVELSGDFARDVAERALEEGLLVNDVAPNALRLCPPLILEKTHCDKAAETLSKVLGEFDGRAS